jgi:hypothetical protein
VDEGQVYKVGEAGWEYFVPSASGYILNHGDAVKLAQEAIAMSSTPVSPTVVVAGGKGRGSDRELLDEFRRLREQVVNLAAAPRSMHVSSPQPLRDGAKLWADFSKQRIRASGK